MIDYSIIVPSLHSDLGRRTLRVFLECLLDNTEAPYELLLSSHHEEGGTDAINQLAAVARADYLIILADDIYVAPGWDRAFTQARAENLLAVGVLIESGDRPVSADNLEKDYGRTPEDFDRAAFEAAAAGMPEVPHLKLGWSFPWCVARATFLDRGGIPVVAGDVYSRGDFYFWRDWQDDGLKVRRVPAYGYHLQAWTGRVFDNATGRRRDV